MKKPLLMAILIGVCSLGCHPYPRYRTAGDVRRAEAPTAQTGYTTNDRLRLGSILRSFLGTSYAGRSRYGSGLDCSQLVRDVFNQFDGRILPRTVDMLYTDGVEMHRNHLDFGDLVFFKTDHSAVSHVGIFTGEDQFLHASSSRGVIISSMSETYWAKRYVGARRILLKQRPDREP